MADSQNQDQSRALAFRNDGQRFRQYDLNGGCFVDEDPDYPQVAAAEDTGLISPPPHSNFWYEPVGKQRKM